MCQHLGVADLGACDVLDFGCGVRFTQAFSNRAVPVQHCVGVDVSREVVDFLRANVSDPRFEYFHLDAQNDLYNPSGRRLAELAVPELEGRRFDVICLFSVSTHLSPVALYRRGYAIELVDGTGWELRSLSPPTIHGVQHYIVCTPV